MPRFGSTSGLGSSSPGNGGGRDRAFGAALMQELRDARRDEARRRPGNRPAPSADPSHLPPQYVPPAAIVDPVPAMPARRKASGYGGVARPSRAISRPKLLTELP
jgi:hypothetical protein